MNTTVSPEFFKQVSFSSLDFKREKLYGDGTERIKVETGRSFERAAFEYFFAAIESGESEVVNSLLQSMVPERRDKISSQITELSQSIEEEQMAANS